MDPRDEKYARIAELFQIIHRIRFSNILECKENDKGMSLPEFAIALCMNMMMNEGVKQILVSDLVKRLPSSPQAISKYLKQLEKRGLVERLPVKKDRRNTEIRLTENGKKSLEFSRNRMQVFYREVFEGISDEEFNSMMRFFSKICGVMAERSGEIAHKLDCGDGNGGR